MTSSDHVMCVLAEAVLTALASRVAQLAICVALVLLVAASR